jgi:Uncharacterised nucleotidyltransferase
MNWVPGELWPIVSRLAVGRWPPCGEAEIAAFFDHAIRQKLFPLLIADTDVPPEIAAAKPRFRALAGLYRKRYELSRGAIAELQRVIGADAFLFLKGADYCQRLYPRPEYRPMTDVDVYMPFDAVPSALQRLAAAGYPRKYNDYGACFAPGYHVISVEIQHVQVEIHRSFAQRLRANIDYDGIWQRREFFKNDDVSGYRQAPADAILSHAFELAKDEFSSQLSRYLDFYLLVQRHGDELRECVARAKAWGIERALFGALQLTSSLFSGVQTNALKEASDRLLDASTRQFLVKQVLPDPATEPSGHATGRYRQLWRKYALMDRLWRRGAFLAYHIYQTAVGRAVEWRVRRNGVFVPPRPSARLR